MDDSSDGMGRDDESHGSGWSVVKRKNNGPAISATDSSGTSTSVENVKKVKVVLMCRVESCNRVCCDQWVSSTPHTICLCMLAKPLKNTLIVL